MPAQPLLQKSGLTANGFSILNFQFSSLDLLSADVSLDFYNDRFQDWPTGNGFSILNFRFLTAEGMFRFLTARRRRSYGAGARRQVRFLILDLTAEDTERTANGFYRRRQNLNKWS
jgi:hypothetical protein